MKTLNKTAAEIARKFKPNAVTDVTGFGLVGHLIEICNASNVSAEINFSNIELLPGTVKFLEQGIMPGGSKRNLKHAENFTIFNPNLTYNQKLITCDAQTSGGLLITLSNGDANKFIEEFGKKAKIIGEITSKKNNSVSVEL